MQTSDTSRQDLRERYLKYITEHARGNRVPTVADACKTLGVTNYLLLKCIRELKREGLLICTSRKSGLQLCSCNKKRRIIGLLEDHGHINDYLNNPAWMSGFCSVFARESDVVIRHVHSPKIGNLPKLFQTLGLDILLLNTSAETFQKVYEVFPENMRCRLVGSIRHNPQGKIACTENVIYTDSSWADQYIEAALRHGCRNFVQILSGGKDAAASSAFFSERLKAHHLLQNENLLIFGHKNLRKKLETLRKKYQIDAIRCSDTENTSALLELLREWREFRPFIPMYGHEECRRIFTQADWVNGEFLAECEDDYFVRMGRYSGEKAVELLRTRKSFKSEMFPRHYVKKGC